MATSPTSLSPDSNPVRNAPAVSSGTSASRKVLTVPPTQSTDRTHYPAFKDADLPRKFRSGYLPIPQWLFDSEPDGYKGRGQACPEVPLLHYGFLVPNCLECLDAAARKLGIDVEDIYARCSLDEADDWGQEYELWGPLEDKVREHVGPLPSRVDLVSPRDVAGAVSDADRVVAIHTNRKVCHLRRWFKAHSAQKAEVEGYIKSMLALPEDAQPMWYFGPTAIHAADFQRFLRQLQPHSTVDDSTDHPSAQTASPP